MSKVKVLIIESERGWGQKIEETKYFETFEEADKFCDDFNKANNQPTVPDWYMYAKIDSSSLRNVR